MRIQLDGIGLDYHVTGDGRPVLMLHGGYLDYRHMMDEMEPVFSGRPGWMRIYPDLPGQGKSEAPDWISNQSQILRVVQQLVEAVIPGQRFAAAGMSIGGHLVRGLVHEWPDRLTGVMFNATPFVTDYDSRDVPQPMTLSEDDGFAAEVGDAAETLRRLAPVLDGVLAGWSRRNFVPARDLLRRDFALRSWEPENYAFEFEIAPLARPFGAPALILCGRQDAVAGYRDAWPAMADYQRATFAVLDRAGHFVEPAQSALFRALAGDWLDRIEATMSG